MPTAFFVSNFAALGPSSAFEPGSREAGIQSAPILETALETSPQEISTTPLGRRAESVLECALGRLAPTAKVAPLRRTDSSARAKL